jgi:ATP-binding cassette subfamily B protein
MFETRNEVVAAAWEQETDPDNPTDNFSAADVRKVADFLAPFMMPHTRVLILLAGILLVETLVNVCFSLAQRYLIDHALLEKSQSVIFVGMAILAAAAVSVTVLGLSIDYFNSRLVIGITGDIRDSLFHRCQGIHISYFEEVSGGEILSRFSGDTAAIEAALLEAVAWFILPLLQVAYSTSLMFYFNFWLGCFASMIFPVTLLLPRYFARRTFDLNYRKRLQEGRLLAAIHENVLLQPVIRAFGHGLESRKKFAQVNSHWRRTSFKAAFLGALVERSALAGVYLLHVGIFAFGVWAVYSRIISVGTLVVFEALFLAMGEALIYAMEYIPKFAAAAGAVRHINELLIANPDVPEEPNAPSLPSLSKEIKFKNVSYTFPGNRFQVGEINISIQKGTKVAITGPSGSGKSTILELLLRIRDPTEGEILFDGINICTMAPSSVRAKIGFVSQEPLLFSASIRDNIAVGNLRAGVAEIERAAIAAEIDQFVRSLPLGYDTVVGEAGAALSLGQKQRICIARALVRDPDILILDEPTSALDSATEASLNETLFRVGSNRTIIFATHRLDGVADKVDQVIAVDNGKVREGKSRFGLQAVEGNLSALASGNLCSGSA